MMIFLWIMLFWLLSPLETWWATRPNSGAWRPGGSLACLGLLGAFGLAWGGVGDVPAPFSGFIYLDQLALTFITLVSFLGWAVLRFSSTYLRDEASRPRFLRTLAVAILQVQGFLISASLWGTALFWLASSVLVHHLLRHYSDRKLARQAAIKKFVLSRIGDVAFVSAILLLSSHYGTSQVREIVARASDGTVSLVPSLAGALLALAAMLKSAQFPFHFWLPETLDAPTPVSAYLHAGVVNAGPYLLIRLWPLIQASQLALAVCMILGVLTAVFGVLVMSLQTDVKKRLAWSTVAQMGFVFFEIGIALPGAALLHLLGHSLYKAHAFLRSGTLPSAKEAANQESQSVQLKTTLAAALAAFSVLFMVGWATDSLAFAHGLSWALFGPLLAGAVLVSRGSGGWIAAAATAAVFGFTLPLMDRWLEGALFPSTPHPEFSHVLLWLSGIAVALFLSVPVLLLVLSQAGPKVTALRTHLRAGLYFGLLADVLAEKIRLGLGLGNTNTKAQLT